MTTATQMSQQVIPTFRVYMWRLANFKSCFNLLRQMFLTKSETTMPLKAKAKSSDKVFQIDRHENKLTRTAFGLARLFGKPQIHAALLMNEGNQAICTKIVTKNTQRLSLQSEQIKINIMQHSTKSGMQQRIGAAITQQQLSTKCF